MDKQQEYLGHSKACVQIAKTAIGAERVMLLHIAETWLRLAEEVEGRHTLH